MQFKQITLALAVLALGAGAAGAQTKVTNQGVSPTEIVIGTTAGIRRG